MILLVSAYACAPDRGSEHELGYKMCLSLAKYVDKLIIITESENALALDPVIKEVDTIEVHYVDIGSNLVRRMCWNQGNWLFYIFYRLWSVKVLNLARKLTFDATLKLNMIGFREPGSLCNLSGNHFWGPIGGFNILPINYYKGYGAIVQLKTLIRNILNKASFHLPHVRRSFNKTNGILFATSEMLTEAESRFDIKNSLIIPETGIDEVPSKNLLSRKKSRRFIWIGKDVPRKQLLIALEIFKVLGPNFVLDVYGVEEKRYDWPENVRLKGKIPRDELLILLESYDAMIYTSIDDGTPHAVLESLSRGLPVIMYKVCGMGLLFNDNYPGYISLTEKKADIDKFASSIRELRFDEYYPYLSRLENNLWDVKAKSIIEFIDKCMKK